MKKIGVNGFGRIGRYFTRMTLDRPDVDVAVVNDLADIKTLAHLFKYDSVHRQLKHEFKLDGNKIIFENGKQIVFVSERNPENIAWAEHGVDVVLESTGIFRTEDAASKHFKGGARKVILSAPSKSGNVRTVVLGVNDHMLESSDLIISNASCTTNSAAPMVRVMQGICEIESAFITTIHSYTSDQRLHDAPHRDLRRARAAAESIVPTTTGAAIALSKIFPELDGRIGGCGIRVPVPNGSMTDLTLVIKNPPSAEVINVAMQDASKGYLKGILEYTNDPIVSSDIIGNPNSCLFDSLLTSVIGNMVKIVGWYDNESGYSNRLVDLAARV
ncbi:MAG: type I glyceraldehyde-3-phosphate dehydrogenase [Crocinitomicaceae bacterium]|nr:type I glyceraldehyde-3-phosphate dehydrogenase [Crocinitomicaceae bacterium]MDG1657292.1 type I glyceraldehyde-3-phosphate dehydrogenase [Crocinitomicaceae bacterium]|tara:strand:- start:2007 stop:2996 length:990 start_codon:yes stop_codon:yes gene_type:complete